MCRLTRPRPRPVDRAEFPPEHRHWLVGLSLTAVPTLILASVVMSLIGLD